MDAALLLPELIVFLGGLGVLLLGSFLPRTRQWVGQIVAGLALSAALIAAFVAWTADAPGAAFSGTFALDAATHGVRVIAPGAALLVLALAGGEWRADRRESELYALVLFATAGVLVVGGAQDVLVLIAGYLLTSVPVMALIGLRATGRAAEAAMKTYLVGALFGIVLMGGAVVLVGATGVSTYADLPTAASSLPTALTAIGVLAVSAGLFFEAGAVPAHFWIPDAATAATSSVAAFVTTVPKVGAFVAVFRLAELMPHEHLRVWLYGGFAVVTMLLGTLAAFVQQDARRLLGWSTVGQAGFLLIPAAIGSSDAQSALVLYLAGYATANIAAFAVTAVDPQLSTLQQFCGFSRAHPWASGALLVALLGLIGTPPTAVFLGKVAVASAAWEAEAVWLAIAVVVVTAISLFPYLRWFARAFGPAAADEPAGPVARPNAAPVAVAVVGAAATILIGLLGATVTTFFAPALLG